MQDDKFGCCHNYRECSNAEMCIHPEKMERCQYWTLNLSKGRNFYNDKKDKPKIESNYVYIVKGKKVFRVSGANERNYSYKLSQEAIKNICEEFERCNITHTIECYGYECIDNYSKNNPGVYRINFSIGEHLYNINGYKSFGINELEAIEINAMLPKEFNGRIIRLTPDGYFNIPSNKGMQPIKEVKKEIKIKTEQPKIINGWKYQQLSFI